MTEIKQTLNLYITKNDWREGQRVEVVAYADFPYRLEECALMEVVE